MIEPLYHTHYFNGARYVPRSKWIKPVKWILGVVFATTAVFHTSVTASYFQRSEGVAPTGELITFVQRVNKQLNSFEAHKIVQAAQRWGNEFNIDPRLLLSIAKVESSFDRLAISNAGAMGLYQVMMRVHVDKIIRAKKRLPTPELFDVNTNTYIGAMIFRDCLDRFGKVDKALRCYNGSIGLETDYDNKVLTIFEKLK